MIDEGYRCEATTLEGFVQQLAVGYVSRGYWFYVTGFIPAGKDPHAVDEKLISRYGLAISKWTRARRKQTGAASVQYLRFRRYFVLLATLRPTPVLRRGGREHPGRPPLADPRGRVFRELSRRPPACAH